VLKNRITALSVTMITFAALAAACDPGAAETPSAAGSASASAAPADTKANTDEVCTAVNKDLIDGSVQIADDAVKSIDEHWTQAEQNTNLKKNLHAISVKVAAEADKATDPEMRKTITDTAAKIEAGAKRSDALAYMQKEFVALTKDFDTKCGV
jgi:hypothetical protein